LLLILDLILGLRYDEDCAKLADGRP